MLLVAIVKYTPILPFMCTVRGLYVRGCVCVCVGVLLFLGGAFALACN